MSADCLVRPAQEEDAGAIARMLARGAARNPALLEGAGPPSEAEIERLAQTGHAFLVAEHDGEVVGSVRHHEEDGIGWFDLLAAGRAGAGGALVAAVERLAQDRGLRLVRARVPEDGALPDYFGRRGYTGMSRERMQVNGNDVPMLVMEKRVPLLTVREQRRSDADAIAALTGEDAWFFEQMARPGWFVAADGDRVVGAIAVRDGGTGLARVAEPVLAAGYGGRGLEIWMIERAAYYAETNGYHSAEVPITSVTRPLERALEDRRWFPEGDVYVRRFAGRAAEREEWA
ncbi:MAG TPA: GNAT family N-acetyltransferase [Tepidiformaceae bacterium]|nr:GNAT family N-acetyltransferase [Tepidiformaceae bacterium]